MIKNNLRRKLLFLLYAISIFFTICPTAWSITYYVSFKIGNNSNNGMSPHEAWKTISKVNRSYFNPGDQILLKKGEMWRERLTISSSGIQNNTITYSSYGSGSKPIINGAVVVKKWNKEVVRGKIIFSAMTDIDGKPLSRPNQVFYKDNRLAAANEACSDLNLNQWKWVYPKLYINVAGDPTHEMVEVSSGNRRECIIVNRKSFISINDITIKKANQDGLLITNGSSEITINNIVASKNYWAGINVWDESEKQHSGTVKNSRIEDNASSGMHFSNVQQWMILRNEVHRNCRLKEHSNHHYTAGIKLDGLFSTGNIIENNRVSESVNGCGIWLDFCGRKNIIRYNDVYDNYSAGIMNEITSGTKIYYNKSYFNGKSYNYKRYHCNAAGIFIWGRTGQFPHAGPSNDNLIYNNLCFANTFIGIILQGDGKSERIIDNNIVMNNISVENLTQLRVGGGAEKTDAKNVLRNNCFGNKTYKFIEWGWGVFKSSYHNWEEAYGIKTDSIEASPLFTDAANMDFSLKYNSQCINAGTSVGLKNDFTGKSIIDIPDVGPYEW